MMDMVVANLLLKIAGHPEDRLAERTQLSPRALDPVRKGLKRANLPAGSHHVRLKDGSYAVVKDVSKRGAQPRHVVATVLSEDMSPPGYDVTYDVMDVDPDDVRVVNFSEGDNAKRKSTYSASERRGPGSYAFTESKSLSSVKVAMIDMGDVVERLDALTHDPESLKDYAGVIKRQSSILHVDPRSLKAVKPPSNSSPQTKAELQLIDDVMQEEPLPERFVERASANVNDVFYDMCDVFDLDAQPELAEELAADVLKVAMYLKYKYMRPRPYQLAPYYDSSIDSADRDAESTPAYPSGHSMVGFALAKLYSDMYPQHRDDFERLGDKVALSRIQAGVHYPSDVEYARLLVDQMLA